MLTIVCAKSCDDPGLVERETLCLQLADHVLGGRLLGFGALGGNVKGEAWGSGVDLVGEAVVLAVFVQAEEDEDGCGLARVEGLDHLLFGLIEDVRRDELANLLIFGKVQFGGGASQRGEVVEHEELSARMLKCSGEEGMFTTQE